MKNFSYGLLIILLGVIIPVNSYSQRLIDLYEKLPKSNFTLEKQVFDSSGNLRSTFKLKCIVDSQNNSITEYQDVNNLVHIVKKIYYRTDGQIESILIEDSCEKEIIKYFYNKDRLDYIIKYSNGILFEKMKYSYSGEVEKVKYYLFNLNKFVLGYTETFVYNNNFLQEKTVYSKALKRISEKAIYKRLSKNDTSINSVIVTDFFNNSSSIDTINYKGQIIRIVYNGSQSNRDEYTYLSQDSMMLVKYRENEVEYFEKSAMLFGEFVPYVYDDKKYGVKGEIYFDKVTHTATEKVIDLDGNVTIITFKIS